MTLQEKIQKIKIDKGAYIHIGSGSGYFFVGTKEEYESEIDGISNKYREILEEKMRISEKELNERNPFTVKVPDLPSVSTEEINDYVKALSELIEDSKRKIEKEIADVKRNYNTYHSCKRYLENWVDFKNREVTDTYDRISGDGVVVVIEGCEAGDYWDRKEFLRKNEVAE